jgi:glucose/arabinose dehydrogenase
MRRSLAALALLLLLPASAHALTLEPVGTFASPIDVAAPPGDTTRLFVVERGGTIRVIKDGVTLAAPFLEIPPAELSTDGERGLLAMAFAPDYATSGRVYTYSTDAGGDIRVDEWQRSANPEVASPARALVLRIEHSLRNNHNGGDLHFGPDGLLYISTGDGGGADDPDGNGQTLIRAGTSDEQSTALLAKLLRIAPSAGGGYAIPADNPFAGRADARGEIWAYGLRNPFRFSFDRATGDLLIGDVGQDDAEEIDFAAAPGRGRGANFGWKCFEGALPNDGTMPPCTPPGHVPPVFEYDKAGCQAITGGYVVRDPGLPSLLGRYVYGDYCDGVIRSLMPSTGAGDAAVGLDLADFTLASFGEDACGRVYVAQLSGAVSRLVDGTASPCTPASIVNPPAPFAPIPGVPTAADPDGDGVPVATDRCPAAAHATSDGCPAFVRLTVTSPQRSALTKRVSVRQITSNVSGRLTLSGRLRHRSRSLNVWLRRATLTVVAGKTRSGSLAVSAPKRRIINRRLRSGRVEVDVTARLGGVVATARTRIKGK